MSTPARVVLAFSLLAGAFLAGYFAHRWEAPVNATRSPKQVLYYTCPMHPNYKSDRPGDAPCCGMRLEPVYADSDRVAPSTGVAVGTVEINRDKQQLMGVRLGTVEKSAFTNTMRYPGRVAVDETRIHRWNAAVDGWIRFVSPHSTGSLVKKGELIATFYAPEFQGAEQGYLFGLSSWDRFQATGRETPEQLRVAKLALQQSADSLRNLGMSETQLAEMGKDRAATENIKIYSPVTGFIIARNVSPGQRFDKGLELYRFADIGHVWVMADVFEKDRELIRPGAPATVRYQGLRFHARMSDVLPQFDQTTRTLKTRFELENPDLILRPDMFVDLELEMKLPASVHVPVEAVLDSGVRKTVYVNQSNGFFEPRQVETGWRLGEHVQITKGLAPGERIVVSGNFLIDSESRMKSATAGAVHSIATSNTAGAEIDLVCRMEVDPKKPNAIKTEHKRRTYFFCSENCRKLFEQNPDKYVPKSQPRQAAHQDKTERGPV